MTIVQIDHVKSPSDLTTRLLTTILEQDVTSLEFHPLGRGVMSNVQILTVTYNNTMPNNQFLVKFQKPEIPMPDLFSVEGEFYRIAEETSLLAGADPGTTTKTSAANSSITKDSLKSQFPFQLVQAVAAGPSWLLLQYIPPEEITTLDVTSGCPPEQFNQLILRLAELHATCWIEQSEQSQQTKQTKDDSSKARRDRHPLLSSLLHQNSNKLSCTPGVGHDLPIDNRQASFANAWPAVRRRLAPFFSSLSHHCYLKEMDGMVEWAAQSRRIKTVANAVSEKKYTLIHGDFHVGNMLFPTSSPLSAAAGDGDDNNDATTATPWLVDWSMAGIGNPLIDLVFFLVVGAHVIPIYEEMTEEGIDSSIETTSKNLDLILHQYFQALNGYSTKNAKTTQRCSANSSSRQASSPPLLLSWEEFLSMFRQCILNQFIILVCYDGLCRSMAEASPSDELKELYHRHFDRVNVRCVRMLLSEFGWREDILD